MKDVNLSAWYGMLYFFLMQLTIQLEVWITYGESNTSRMSNLKKLFSLLFLFLELFQHILRKWLYQNKIWLICLHLQSSYFLKWRSKYSWVVSTFIPSSSCCCIPWRDRCYVFTGWDGLERAHFIYQAFLQGYRPDYFISLTIKAIY